MKEIETGINLDHIFDLRKKFTIIGLTGKTGSGCSEVSTLLTHGFKDKSFTDPKEFFRESRGKIFHNAYRSHRICYNYAKENFKSFDEIKYKDVITLFILTEPLDNLINYLNGECVNEFLENKFPSPDFTEQIKKLNSLESNFSHYSKIIKEYNLLDIKKEYNYTELHNLFFNDNFKNFSNSLHRSLGKGYSKTALDYHKFLQIITNNLRKSGKIFDSKSFDSVNIFTIVEVINYIIKSHRRNNTNTQIVINSLKNPMEIMFFKHRYSAFYAIAINKDPESLKMTLHSKFNGKDELTDKLIQSEYKGKSDKYFHYQKIEECLQLADIHISFLEQNEEEKKDDVEIKNNETRKLGIKYNPCFTWQDQILKYITLIDHPGIVQPSSEERCMQLAYSAKLNSGCISRQVGATITDSDYSVKAIGWNNTPSGQVPCSLRNTDDLLKNSFDIESFTNYEKSETNKYNSDFQKVLMGNFDREVISKKQPLNGRNVSFCFKTLKNSFSEGKNQVHTRSLHAEENAFLQLTKYGGTGIRNGILFSTASTCELCSKKAYQLEIKLIYYIDPYPGISYAQILSTGEKPIVTRLFTGAIGNAYFRLFQPFMAYKDELSLILGHNIKDVVTQLNEENKILKEKIKEFEEKNK